MKKMIKKLMAVAVAGVLTFGALPVSAAEAAGEIRVTGTGSVSVKPDIAYVNLGVQTIGKDAKSAQKQNNDTMAKVIEAMKALGFDEKDLQTSGYYIYPQYDYEEKTEKITGYTVVNSVMVTVRKIDEAGTVMDAGIDAGANYSFNVQFSVADPTEYYNQALEAAIKNAYVKADVIAKSIHVKLTAPISVNETSGYNFSSKYYMADMAAGSYNTRVQPGSIDVTASVEIVYGY